MDRLGWLHQSSHGARVILERLKLFEDDLPYRIRIDMEDGDGRITTYQTFPHEGLSFIEALSKEMKRYATKTEGSSTDVPPEGSSSPEPEHG